jgi:glyoxylase-like metal-dependent hydrolase (beta-lactamase superfamily II)
MGTLTEITAGVLVATAQKFVTTSTVIRGRDGECLVIDPSVSPEDVAAFASGLAGLGLNPAAGFATHPHWDHLLWNTELGDVPRYASSQAVETAVRERAGLIERVQNSAPGHDLELFARVTPLPWPGRAISWDGPETVIVTHQGHAPGHSAVFLPDRGVLIAGDMCSDLEIPLLDTEQPDPLGDYQAGLDVLAALPVRQVIPGHGHVGDSAEFRRRLDADRRYLDALSRGAEPDDSRLTTDWLVTEHRHQVTHLAGLSGWA